MYLKQIKFVPILLLVLLFALQYRLWFEAGGLMDLFHLKKQLALEEQENAILKKRNEDLLHQVEQLKSNPDEVESRARQELGMIKKDETFYQIIR